MSTSNLQLIETSKLFSEEECVEIVRKTLNCDNVSVKSVELFGNKTVFGFLGEYFRLVINVNDGNEAKLVSTKSFYPLKLTLRSSSTLLINGANDGNCTYCVKFTDPMM